MKKLLATVLAIMMLLSTTAMAEGALVMATNPEFAPFEYVENGEVVGFDVDLATEIAKDLGVDLQIESMAFDSIIAAIQTGKADVGIAGMSITEERLLTVDFSIPYINAKQAVIVLASSDIKQSADIKDKLIGVQLGTTGDLLASEQSATVERYQKALDAVLELKGGKLDAVVIDLPVANNIVTSLGATDLVILDDDFFESEEYGIAIAKNQPELLESINATITRLKEDGSIDAMYAKYVSGDTVQ